MRLLLYSALLSCASGVTWHVGNTGQSCDYTCTQLNPSKSCALGSFSSAAGSSSNFNNVVAQIDAAERPICASTSSTSNHLGPFFDDSGASIVCSYYDGSGAAGNCLNGNPSMLQSVGDGTTLFLLRITRPTQHPHAPPEHFEVTITARGRRDQRARAV